MITPEQIRTIRLRLGEAPKFEYQVAWLGCDVWHAASQAHETERQELVSEYVDYVTRYGYKDVLRHNVEYAGRLVTPIDRQLLFEEVAKLFYLCDEIECLRNIGLPLDEDMYTQLQISLRHWFAHNREVAHIVAGITCEPWKQTWWWYAENMS